MTADKRGWGTPDRLHGSIVRVQPAGISLWVNEHVAWLLEHALNRVAFFGYPLAGVADDWGYAKRYIRGLERLRVWSNHAWGLAVDLNATRNPMTSDGVVHTDMPFWVIQIMAEHGFAWGGAYTGARKDPMHFEFLGTPEQAYALVRALQAADAARPTTTAPRGDMGLILAYEELADGKPDNTKPLLLFWEPGVFEGVEDTTDRDALMKSGVPIVGLKHATIERWKTKR